MNCKNILLYYFELLKSLHVIHQQNPFYGVFFLANSILNNKFSIGILLKKLVGDLVLINEILMFFSNWGKYRDANAIICSDSFDGLDFGEVWI